MKEKEDMASLLSFPFGLQLLKKTWHPLLFDSLWSPATKEDLSSPPL
jgi:hypothetical protein